MGSLFDDNGDKVSIQRLANSVSISIDTVVTNLQADIEARDASLQAAQIDALYSASEILVQCSQLLTNLEIDTWL